jgi:Sigma-70, region 4
VRRETYVGEWLPEPIVTSAEDDPALHAEMADSLSLALLVLLESLSPEQRAVFLLREVFDYGYGEIAEIVGKSEENTRQLATRARRHVDERRPRFEASVEQRDALADRFFAAAQQGELEPLEALLAEDVELYGDGGGKVPALARVLRGRARVARTLAAWGRQGRKLPGVTQRRVDINGQPGALLYDAGGKVLGALALEIFDGRVQTVRSVVNPDKLRHLGEVADMRAVLRSGDH